MDQADTVKRARITKTAVDDAEPQAERYTLWDTELKGFGVRVTPQGTKTFIARYRVGGGRTGTLRQQVIGRYGALTAEQARKDAKSLLADATRGKDPQGARADDRAEMTVSTLCDLYLAEGCSTKKAGTLYTDGLRIKRHVKPLLGHLKVSKVTKADVERFMVDVAIGKTRTDEAKQVRGGKGTAARTVGMLGSVFSFAVDRGLRTDNPVRGVKRYRDRKMERFLSPKELGALGDVLADLEGKGFSPSTIAIVRLLALTGARKTEIAALRWSEIDIERGCLRLADSKTGAKVIPLGAPAMKVLGDLPRHECSEYVFPHHADISRPHGRIDHAWRVICKRAGLDATRIHDLRHSFASTGLAAGHGLPLIGKLLGHANVTTTGRYAHLADDPVRAAADRISETIAGAMRPRERGDNVVPLPTKAG